MVGKKIDPKLATPQSDEKSTKVFVGGLDRTATKEDITEAFATRGNVSIYHHFYSRPKVLSDCRRGPRLIRIYIYPCRLLMFTCQ